MDNLIKALALGGRVRVFVLNSTQVLNDAIINHDLWPSAASVFGKSLSISLMMGSMLKGDETTTIQIDGNGPIGNIFLDSNALGNVRGYVRNAHVHFSRKHTLDDVTTLGYNGYINVLKDLKMKDFYSSTVPLQTGDLAKDFAYYFTTSEQTPTLLCLGTLIKEDNTSSVNGGILIQLMPGALDEDITYLESKIPSISKFSDLLLKYDDLEDILKLVFDDYVVLDKIEVSYYCDCTKEKYSEGIASLGKDEVNDIIQTDGKAEIQCHYCNKLYHYSKEELIIIKEGIK